MCYCRELCARCPADVIQNATNSLLSSSQTQTTIIQWNLSLTSFINSLHSGSDPTFFFFAVAGGIVKLNVAILQTSSALTGNIYDATIYNNKLQCLWMVLLAELQPEVTKEKESTQAIPMA